MRARRRSLIPAILLLAYLTTAFASGQVISHLKDVRKLSSAEAERRRPVQITGVVTALSGWKNSFFLEESGTGISVDRTDQTEVHPGDRVEVSGETGGGLFAPVVVAHEVRVLGHGDLPAARRATYQDLVGGKQDSQWIEIQGVVRSAKISESWGRQVLFLLMDIDGGLISARVHDFEAKDYSDLVDATVRVRGVCGTNFNERRQFVGLRLFVADLSEVHIEQAPPSDRFAIPESPLENLFRFTASQSASHRVKVSGTVTYAKPEGFLFLQSGETGISINTAGNIRFEPGERVEAAGFVASGEYSPALQDAIIRKISAGRPVKPVHVVASQVIQYRNGFAIAPYDGVLVEIDGEVVSQMDQPSDSVWYLRDGQTIFQAHLQKSSDTAPVPRTAPASHVRLTGICVVVTDQNRDPKSFHILLRSAADIVVTRKPLLSLRNTLWLVGFLLLICFAMLIWVLRLRRALIPSSKPEQHQASNPRSGFLAASKFIGQLTATFGLLVLAGGWIFHAQFLMLMRPNTALCVFLIGAAASLQRDDASNRAKRAVQFVCLSTSTLIAILTIAEYASGVDLHVDRLLIVRGSTLLQLERMRLASALCYSLLGLSGLLLGFTRRIRTAQSLILTAGGISLLSVLAFLYGVRDLFGFAGQHAMRFGASFAAIAICAALLLSHPENGFMRTASSDAPGGILARRLLPAAIIVPAALGWLRWQGQLKGLYDTNLGLAIFAYANIVAFSLLIWMTAWLLNRLEVGRLQAETQTRIAEEANRAKSEFLAVVSHEIRTPMNSILGMAEVLAESPLNTTQRRYIEVLRRAGSNLMTLINDILDLSKLEAGKLELERIEFDLKELVNQVAEIIETNARAKGLALRTEWGTEVAVRVLGDPLRLQQVVINLLGNAVKFTEHGSIQISVRNAAGQPGWIEFAVSDTGIGIPEDKLETIFGDFTQADSSTTRRYGGTGLGLGITRRLVQLMGGSITVTSAPGEGSTFRFAVPLEPVHPRDSGPAANSETVCPREHTVREHHRILIADDSPDNRLLLETYLQGTGHRLRFVENGQEAVEKFEQEKFDLILMDMHMPVMDGLTATRALRRSEQKRNLSRIPVIALTANARPEDIQAAREAGCDAHLSKPLSKLTLLTALEPYRRRSETADTIGMQKRIKIKTPEGLGDLAARYLAARRSELAALNEALRNSNFEHIRTLAHNLKGTGSSFGFEELTALGAALETSASRQDSRNLQKQVAALEEYLANVELSES